MALNFIKKIASFQGILSERETAVTEWKTRSFMEKLLKKKFLEARSMTTYGDVFRGPHKSSNKKGAQYF